MLLSEKENIKLNIRVKIYLVPRDILLHLAHHAMLYDVLRRKPDILKS